MIPSLRALAHRDYRLFFAGQGVSLIGTWMNRLASSWLVYRLTNDPFMLGVVNAASLGPTFVLGPFAGVLVDRHDVRRLLIITQTIAMTISFSLAALSGAHASGLSSTHVTIGILLMLNVVQGVVTAFDTPGRQVMLPRMIPEPRDLQNGVALNSTLFHAARLVGPAIAGFIIAAVGETWCFFIDGSSFIGVVAALYAMRGTPEGEAKKKARGKILHELREGLHYARDSIPIRSVLLLVAFTSFFGMPYTVLLPVFAREIFNGDSAMLGLLTSATGLGALTGAVLLARRESLQGLPKLINIAGAIFSLSLVAFATSRTLALSVALLLGTGFGMLSQNASCSTILQTIVTSDKRGRIMSLYSTAFLGMAPLGGLFSSFVARHFGAPAALAVGGVASGVAAMAFARHKAPVEELVGTAAKR